MSCDYVDKDIVCPFYQKVERTKIHCEGIDEKTLIHLWFINKEYQKLHEVRYCMNLTNYKNCPLYTIIARQYENKEV